MALYQKKEFAFICGKSTSNLTTYIKRGKIILRPDKLIDDAEEINQAFLDKWRSKADAGSTTDTESTGDFDEISSPESKKSQQQTHSGLSQIKLQREIELKEIAIKKGKIEYDQLVGKSIPVEVVKDLFRRLGVEMITAYKDGAESLLVEINHKFKIPDGDRAILRGNLIGVINRCHERAIAAAKKGIEQMVLEFKKGEDEPVDTE